MTDELSESIEQILFQNRIKALNRQKEAIKRQLHEVRSCIENSREMVVDTNARLNIVEQRLEGR